MEEQGETRAQRLERQHQERLQHRAAEPVLEPSQYPATDAQVAAAAPAPEELATAALDGVGGRMGILGTLPDYSLISAAGGWPELTGYASVADVSANINAGTWDPTKPGAAPTSGQVADMLKMATAEMDIALRTRGYYVPLRGQSGFAPPQYMVAGDLIHGILPQAWFQLRYVCLAHAVHRVLMSRSSNQQRQDTAIEWLHIYDDFMTRLESGADNLTIMGVDGDFEPLADDAQGLGSGALDPKTSVAANDPSTWQNKSLWPPSGIFSVDEREGDF